MEKIGLIRLSFFLSFFSLGYLLLNYYILSSLAGLWGGISTNMLYLVVAVVSLSFPASMVMEQSFPNVFARAMYILANTWLGIALFFLWALILMGIIRLFINIPSSQAGLIIVFLVSLVSAYSIINGYSVHEKNIEISVDDLKTPLRFAQLSDVHIGSVRNSGYLKRLVTKINNINPDAVLITGDLADGSSPISKDTFKSFNDLKMPIFFVSGNHDTYAGLDNVLNALKSVGVIILDNDVVDFKGVQLVGVCYCMQRNMLGSLLNRIGFDKDQPCILMHHLPSEWNAARDNGINLQLSGHTHHGQFYPFNLLVKLVFPNFGGLYKNEEDYLYVSSGTGTWGPPMRLGSKNEVTIINLKPK
jgi:uncharacterized protein